MVTVHHLAIISGQEYRMPVRLVDAAGHAVPIADYDLYGAARRGSETTRMSVAVVDGSSCVIAIPPLEQASYTYDLYLRHRSTTAEVQLLAGNIAVRGRVASMPPVTGGGEDVVAVVSADMTEVQVTVTPIAVATPEAWDRLDRAGDLIADAIETAGALVPDAQRVIQQEVETGRLSIKTASADAVRQAGADIAGAGDREVASAADRIRAVSGQEADAVTAAGDAARQDVVAAGSSATSEALAAIDAATDTGKGAINSSINSGVNAIGQAVTSGTGTINTAVSAGKSSIDSYVASTQADLARKSQPNIWGGVNTFNSSIVANGGLMIAGQDIMRTMWTSALNQTLAILSASGWADTSKGLQFGSAYNGFFYGSESGVTTTGINTTGTLTRTDMAHYSVQKHIAMGSPGELSGLVTLVVRVDTNTVSSALSKKTAYIFGQHMKDTGDVPFDQLISTDYTPNVGNIPTCILTLTDDDKLRLDVLYRTQHRQLILTPQGNYPLRNYVKYFVFVWTPTSFGLYWNAQYPPGPWECLVRITAPSMGELYRVSIHGYDDKNYWNIGMTRAVTALNTLQPLGYADWMTPRITITE